MTIKKIVIPLITGEVVLAFHQSDQAWQCNMSNEAMTDLEQFFNSGRYCLDTTGKKVVVKTS